MNYPESKTIPEIIFSQIDKRVLMSLGASDFGHSYKALSFAARILPITKAGRGSRARVMTVEIELEAGDTYLVRVTYFKSGVREVHFNQSGVYADQLSRILLALDFDGKQVTNPRYWP